MTEINPAIFRAYDIRGKADPTDSQPNPDLTPETVYIIGKAAATYLARIYNAKSMIVGRDNRLHSEKLQKAFMEGVASCGFKVQNAGMCTSPMIYFASCHYDTDCAVNITASHNPKTDNGIKIVRKGAHSVADKEIQEILKLIKNEDFIRAESLVSPAESEQTDPTKEITELNKVAKDYEDKICKGSTLGQTRNRPYKVVIDAGNAIPGAYAPSILRALKDKDGNPACEVIELHCELDGNFPNHEANPEQAKNMIDLSKKVVETRADLGIGFDGDGDRIGLIDENGKFYGAEYPIMLLSRELLANEPGEKIIYDVKVCQNLIDDIERNGGESIMSRVGHSFIENRLRQEKATFAGEKSGHLYFGKKFFDYYGFDDAIFAAAKIVEILSHKEQTFSEIFADMPSRPNIPELKIPCPDDKKAEIIEKVTAHFTPLYSCITLDGVRIQFDDGAWILIRYSSTSPSLTIHAEAPTEERLEEIKEMGMEQLRQFPELKLT